MLLLGSLTQEEGSGVDQDGGGVMLAVVPPAITSPTTPHHSPSDPTSLKDGEEQEYMLPTMVS